MLYVTDTLLYMSTTQTVAVAATNTALIITTALIVVEILALLLALRWIYAFVSWKWRQIVYNASAKVAPPQPQNHQQQHSNDMPLQPPVSGSTRSRSPRRM